MKYFTTISLAIFILVVGVMAGCKGSNQSKLISDPVGTIEKEDINKKVANQVIVSDSLAKLKQETTQVMDSLGNAAVNESKNDSQASENHSKPPAGSTHSNIVPVEKETSTPVRAGEVKVVLNETTSKTIPDSSATAENNTSKPISVNDSSKSDSMERESETGNDQQSGVDIQADVIVQELNQVYPNHELWNSLLSRFVSKSGRVDYKGFTSSRIKLQAYLQELKDFYPTESWPQNEKLAYWLNAYNAFTILKICNNYPLKSITDLAGGKVWDEKWIELSDQKISLNDIENQIIRPQFKDARIHFAVNCAAQSCPPLSNTAFTAANVQSELNRLTKAFVNNNSFNQISKDQVTISKIFEWYKEDFGALRSFLNKFSLIQINEKATFDFMDYNWSLNE